MSDRETEMLTRERGAWIQKGSHDVKRDDEMRSEGGLDCARLKARQRQSASPLDP
jgi:hypothetical protein